MGPVQKERGDLITQNMKKAELPNDFFALVFTDKCSSHTKSQKAKARTGKMKNCLLEEKIRFETI